MNYLVGTLGLPPQSMLRTAKRANKFFNQDMSFTEEMKTAKLAPGFGRELREILPNE